MKSSLRIFILLILFGQGLSAQSDSLGWTSYRNTIIPAGVDSMFLDSLPVLSEALQISDKQGYPLPLNYLLQTSPVSYIKFQTPLTDTLYAEFQVLPLPLNQTFQHKDTSLILPSFLENRDPLYRADNSQNSFTPFAGLNSNGSISRGITIGSNQDAVLNSSLNLQLTGDLGSGTQIRASITDNSVPVQADGYTQQLQEFDKVYIELENESFGLLRAGDYSFGSQKNQFLRFDKRISGAGIFSSVDAGKGTIPIQLQGGIARGKFSRNRFQGSEGNQGPYKLTGNSGEQFIIIISGSERVYIDGVLMKRGEQYDYVIDYNAGEITFTALQPITKERRIVVEFQYTEQNYLRSVVFGESGFESQNFKTNVQYYNEQDSKNQPLLQENSDEEKEILSNAGDRLNAAVVSTVSPSEFSDDMVLYELRDSLGTDSVLVYSTDSTQQLYTASFAYLGPFRGNYEPVQSTANGRVFRWVPPINGQPQGTYEPVKQLVAPNRLQIITVNTEGRIADNHHLKVNLATSKNDINLFSDLDKGNDDGAAGSFQYKWLKKKDKFDLYAGVDYEFNQENFRTIERIRNVEFTRDWNLPTNFNGGIQMGGVNFGLSNDSVLAEYSASILNSQGYNGFKNSIRLQYRDDKNLAALNASFLTTKDTLSNSNFLREQGYYTRYLTPKIWTGVRSVGEWNERQNNNADTLSPGSYNFLEYQFYAGYGDTASNFTELSYLQRYDDTAINGAFENFSRAVTYGLKSQFETNFNSTITAQANVRNLKLYEPQEQDLERTVTGRLNYVQRFWKNSIVSSTFYEAGSGTEPRRNYSYLEVPAGTGTYTHTDYNGNGIKELDEFEIAPSPDLATYVRVYSVTNEYIRTNLLKLGENLNINTPANWRSMDDFRKTLSRFSLLFNYQMDQKTLLTGNTNRLNPFANIADDSLIVALNNNFRSTFFFNRTSTKFGADYTFRNTDNRNLLSYGVEQRAINENTVNLRYQAIEVLLLKLQGSLVDKRNISANFQSRNYEIDELMNLYSLSYQPSDVFILTGRYQWSNQQSMGESENTLLSQTVGADISYTAAQKLNALLSLNYIINDFEGTANGPAGYEMLQSLQPGKNGTWSLTLQRTLKKNILISLNYSGRVSPDTFPIHTGNVEIKAFF